MGHTVWSQRIASDVLLSELKSYGKALRQEERLVYEQLLKLAFKHFGSISYASSIHVWAFLLLSIMLEQEKKIKKMEALYESLVNGCVQEQELNSALDKNS